MTVLFSLSICRCLLENTLFQGWVFYYSVYKVKRKEEKNESDFHRKYVDLQAVPNEGFYAVMCFHSWGVQASTFTKFKQILFKIMRSLTC